MTLNYFATFCLTLAILHTFLAPFFRQWALKQARDSVAQNVLEMLGEVEAVFGIWAAILFIWMIFELNINEAIHIVEGFNYTEPTFVFVVMVVAASRPILDFSDRVITSVAQRIPLPGAMSFFLVILTLGPILGSFITEPAAMTVVALLLKKYFFDRNISNNLKYSILGLLFVNISIGGTLTPFAAPPILMVARVWNWDLAYTWTHLGWKSVIAVFISSTIVLLRHAQELKSLSTKPLNMTDKKRSSPWGMQVIHLIFLALIVLANHHLIVFVALFLFFLGVTHVTREFQSPLKLREGLLVGLFLGGLVVLGSFQSWWLKPLLSSLNTGSLYLGSIFLTSLTDNAALTFLGSQVEGLSEAHKLALVAGSVVGGGLTVIANAPNPVGYGLLNDSFKSSGKNTGISFVPLFQAALLPTLVAGLCLWYL